MLAAAVVMGLLLVFIGAAGLFLFPAGGESGSGGEAVEYTERAEGAGSAEDAERAVRAETTETAALEVWHEAGTGEENGAEDEAESAGGSETGEGGESAAGPVSLVFAGDVLLSDHVLAAYERGGGIRGVVDEGFAQIIDSSDCFIVNQEFPFSDRGTAAPDKQFTFRLPPERVSILQEMGIDLVTLANNHALDFGTDALLDTVDVLDQAGIAHIGAGKNLDDAKEPVYKEMGGMTFAFIGASRVIPEVSWNASSSKPGMLTSYDPALLLEEIRTAEAQADYVVVYIHWGIERKERPESYQRTLGQQYIDAGADLVIGSHPHVLQGLEYYKGKPIVYSLGNFVFGSSIPRTMVLQAEIEPDGTTALRLVPGTSSAGYTRMQETEEEREAFYRYMTEISYGVTIDDQGNVRLLP